MWKLATSILVFCLFMSIGELTIAQDKPSAGKLQWLEATEVDRTEFEELLENFEFSIVSLGRFSCEMRVDVSTDLGERGIGFKVFSSLLAYDGKDSTRVWIRRQDVDRENGTLTVPAAVANSPTVFYHDLLEKSKKVVSYGGGGQYDFELTKKTLDEEMLTRGVFHPMVATLNGGSLKRCTSLEAWPLDANFSPKRLERVAVEGSKRYFLLGMNNKKELDAKGIEANTVIAWEEDVPISIYGRFGKKGNSAVIYRTTTTWKTTDGKKVPTRINHEAATGKEEWKAEFDWKFEKAVPQAIFDPKDLGSMNFQVQARNK